MKLLTISLLVLLALGCGRARKDQMFLGGDRPSYAKDRYECMEKHNDTDNFIACMEARGYKHTGEK